MRLCEKCNKEHDGSYGSGRFCSDFCAHTRTWTKEKKQKTSESVKAHWNDPKNKEKLLSAIHNSLAARNIPKKDQERDYICQDCGTPFKKKLIRKGRKVTCGKCKWQSKPKKLEQLKEGDAFLNLSKRTQRKILKRIGISCVLCGWKEATCDIHHIVPKKYGGTNDATNLIIICPCCHRCLHEHKNWKSMELLQERSMATMCIDWTYWYNKRSSEYECKYTDLKGVNHYDIKITGTMILKGECSTFD